MGQHLRDLKNLHQETYSMPLVFCDADHPVRCPSKDFTYSFLDLSNQDLRRHSFRGHSFSHCNFEGANLSRMNLEKCHFDNCNFNEAVLTKANLKDSHLETCRSFDANFFDASFNAKTSLPFSHGEAFSKGMKFKVSIRERLNEYKTYADFGSPIRTNKQFHLTEGGVVHL